MNFNFFGHKKDTEPTAPTKDTTQPAAEVLPVSDEVAVKNPAEQVGTTPEVTSTETINSAAADIGEAADKLAAIVANETEITGSEDIATPSADADITSVADQVAAFDAAEVATTSVTDQESSTFTVPSIPQETIPTPFVPSQNIAAAEQTNQAVVDTAEPTLGLSEMSDVEVREGFGLEPIPEQPSSAATSETPELDEIEATSIAQQEVPAKGQE